SAPRGDFEIPVPSTNYRLSDLHCAIGITQLARLRELLAARRRVAEAYNERLQGIVQTPSADEGDEHGWQAYIVQLGDRDDALAALRAARITARTGCRRRPSPAQSGSRSRTSSACSARRRSSSRRRSSAA